MPSTQALRTILDSYRFQCLVRGARVPRLAYLSLYWLTYLYAKRLRPASRGDFGAAHLYALERLAASGLSRRLVGIRLPDGTALRIDLFTTLMILKEIHSDAMYGEGGLRAGPGQVVFDVGGQQGVFAVLAATKVGPAGRVVSVEPEPRNFGLLTSNAAANGLANVTAVQAALSDAPGEADLALSDWNLGGHSIAGQARPGAATVRVQVKTVDGLAEELGLSPHLLKIDVEGSAVAVLRGARGTVAAARPSIVMELDSQEDVPAIKALLPEGYAVRVAGFILFADPR